MFLRQIADSQVKAIPDGRDGVAATLRAMADMVREYKKHPRIRDLAAQLTGDLASKDYHAEAMRLHQYVRDEIRYLQDVRGVETVQTPTLTLDLAVGDCDDKALLLAALLESIGHPTRFLAVGFQPGELDHVLVETKIGNHYLAAETTEPVPFGWRPPDVVESMLMYN